MVKIKWGGLEVKVKHRPYLLNSGTHLVTEDAEDGEADDGQQPQPQQGHRHGPLVGWSDLAKLFFIRTLEKYFFSEFLFIFSFKKN